MKRLFELTLNPEIQAQSAQVQYVTPIVPQAASLESHVKLQQHQAEFLAWLENQDTDGDGYRFRKVR